MSTRLLAFLLLTAFVLSSEPAALAQRTDGHGDPLPEGVRFRLGTVRFRQQGVVKRLVWMPDGKTLATASYDDRPRLWRIADGKELHRIDSEGAVVCGLAVTPDGRLLAWGDGSASPPERGRGIHLVDPATGKEVRRLGKGEADFTWAGSVSFSPDGKKLAACCLGDSRTQVYAVDSGKKLLELRREGCGDGVFSPDGKVLVVGAREGILCLDPLTGAEVRKLNTEGNWFFTPVFSPNGKHLAAAECVGKIWVWSWPEGKLLHCLRCPSFLIRGIAFSPDGKTLAAAGDKNYGLSPNGKKLAPAGDKGHSLRLWDLASGKQRCQLEAHEDQVNAVAFSPDGSLLAAAGDNRCISVWDMRAKEPRILTRGLRRFTAAAPTPDGKSVVTAERDGSLVLWSSRDGREVRRLEPWDRPAAKLTISANGQWLAACASAGGLALWDLPTGRRRSNPLGVPAAVGCADFSPQSDAVALGDDMGRAHVYSLKTGTKVCTVPRPHRNERSRQVEARHLGVRSLGWLADGHSLAISYWDNSLTVHDLLLRRTRNEWRRLDGEVSTFAFSADGRLLAVAQPDSCIRVYEVISGREVQQTPPFPFHILCMAFTSDGRTLAVGGGTFVELEFYGYYQRIGHGFPEPDYSIRLWDLVEHKELRQLNGHALQVKSLAFSPTGTCLVSASADATPLSWDMAAFMPRPIAPGSSLSTPRRAALWAELAGRDAVRAQKAVCELIYSPGSALSLLSEKLAPALVAPERPEALLAELDSDDFVRRQEATHKLEQLGERALPALRAALKNDPSLEACRRMESLLARLEGRERTPEQLRTARAVQILEGIGTVEARRILERLAGGAEGASLTLDARASLQRLRRKSQQP